MPHPHPSFTPLRHTIPSHTPIALVLLDFSTPHLQIAIGDKIDVKITQINKAKGQYRVVPTTDVTVTPQADGSEGARRPSGERGRGGRGGGGRRKLSRSGASDAQGE